MSFEPEVYRRSPYGQNPEVGDRARQTHSRILQAAIRVFERYGFQDSRIQDVARGARTARATVYQYFESKHDILRALAAQIEVEMLALVGQLDQLDATVESRKRLRAFLDDFMDLAARYAPIIAMWTDPALSGAAPDRAANSWIDELGRRLAGPESDIDGTAVAVALNGLIERLARTYAAGELSHPVEQVLDELAIVTHAGLYPNAAHPKMVATRH